jgi:hypothetical protein
VTGADVKGKGAAEEGEGVAAVSVSGSRLGVAVSGEAEGLQTWPLTVGCSEVGRRDGSREGRLGGGSGSGGKRGKARGRSGGRRGAVQCVSEWE